MIITQAPYSLLEVSDDQPPDFYSFLGNIGGFWGEQ